MVEIPALPPEPVVVVVVVVAPDGGTGPGVVSLSPAFYFSVTMLTTVGYGDVLPTTPLSKYVSQ